MKTVVKILVWIVVLGAIGFGVYLILPEYPQSIVKSIVQPMIDSTAKARIEQVQAIQYKELNNLTYKAILESQAKNKCWVYDAAEDEPGVEYVTFYGSSVSINLKDWEEYSGILSTGASVKIQFKITGKNVEIFPYIDGDLMYIDDGAHADGNKKIRLDIFTQMYGGMIEDK